MQYNYVCGCGVMCYINTFVEWDLKFQRFSDVEIHIGDRYEGPSFINLYFILFIRLSLKIKNNWTYRPDSILLKIEVVGNLSLEILDITGDCMHSLVTYKIAKIELQRHRITHNKNHFFRWHRTILPLD